MDDTDEAAAAASHRIATVQRKIHALLDALDAVHSDRELMLAATDLILLVWERNCDGLNLSRAEARIDLATAAAGDRAAMREHMRHAAEHLQGRDDHAGEPTG